MVGRLTAAAMHIDDARVSEAHAMVSLRDGALRLLSLRGAFSVRGKVVRDAELSTGMQVVLARGVVLEVLEVVLPEAVLAIEGPRLPRTMLPSVCGLCASPQPRLVLGSRGEADAWIWSVGTGWRLQLSGHGTTRELREGDHFTVAGEDFSVVAMPLRSAGPAATDMARSVTAPLHLVAAWDSFHIHRDNTPVIALQGVLARIASELASVGAPLEWRVLARQVWPKEDDDLVLRHRLDANLSRLRKKLREAGVRPDLVRTDGGGLVELVRYPQDTLEDRV